ncbi:DNA (cytosine-5-)-methyltransferase [Candidatus Peregrinibacteria bacterium RIFOXYB2_FULL_32_7]|nr:MAG: DNA (cytosine-5-)-methyltransferase [Candidatus Peregrinibacteria bacterium RIFOXYB2_FULL_32_7]
MQNIQYLTLGEFFSGSGGLALGAILAESNNNGRILKIKHRWANDYDKDTCETYKKNICKNELSSNVICKDVKKLDINFLSQIDIFAYGFPCNDFSIVGEQKGFNGSFGPLYFYGIEVLNKFKPKAFVAENVGGIASANNGQAFKTILNNFKNAGNGYKITVHLYKSEDYGIPQTRHRYIIVGIDRTLNLEFKVPEPTHLKNPVPVRIVLSNIPKNALNNEYTKTAPQVIERLRHIKPGENAWTARLPDHLKLNVKTAKMSQIYKRLHPDQPSYTITGSGGGGTHGYHYKEPRPLTNRERARIQSFPDDFEFLGSKESVRKQIGMAVPPKLSKIIFTAILDTLNNVNYPSIKSNYQIEIKTDAKQMPLSFLNYLYA